MRAREALAFIGREADGDGAAFIGIGLPILGPVMLVWLVIDETCHGARWALRRLRELMG